MGPDDLPGLGAVLDQTVESVRDQFLGWRHYLHAHPELSNREVRTAAFVAEQLSAAGLDEVRTGIAGHGVVGVLRGGGVGTRVAALRADMDALPVAETSGVDFASTVVDRTYPGGPFPVAHACGHDCHTATVLASAHVLARVRDRLPGTILFVFQPAEEGPPVGEVGGARAMLDAGALTDPEPTMVFGMHVVPLPRGVIGYRVGNEFAASCLVKIIVTGTQVHGSTPWLGADPMPAVGGILTGVGQLYRQVPAYDAVTVSIGHIEDIGRFNIVGGTATLWGTIRCVDEANMSAVQHNLRRLAEHQAAAYGCAAEVSFDQYVPPVHNSREWIEALRPTLARVVGEHNVVAVPPALGYDDVSVFTGAFGGAYLLAGVQDTRLDERGPSPLEGGRGLIPNHHPAFYADDDALLTSLRVHVHVAAGHLLGAIVVNAASA